ncbi:ErfK/YbiS/YcfS/YnhG [Rhodovulum sp. PH10]|nr:ErfK/YbiS/YcfS/YnhG [Rhodovulum sp. PH10]
MALAGAVVATPAAANPFFVLPLFAPPAPAAVAVPPDAGPAPAFAPGGTAIEPEPQRGAAPSRFARRTVDYTTDAPAGTVIVDTPNTYLYFVLGNGRAVRYGIGVGREGFAWSGTQAISRKAEWPDWTPPTEMLRRQPYLPRFMAGGPHNPMGARALYLGDTVYRIHGTNAPETIGRRVSSGCIRMVNDDVIDLYRRVGVGTRVIVLPIRAHHAERRPDARG